MGFLCGGCGSCGGLLRLLLRLTHRDKLSFQLLADEQHIVESVAVLQASGFESVHLGLNLRQRLSHLIESLLPLELSLIGIQRYGFTPHQSGDHIPAEINESIRFGLSAVTADLHYTSHTIYVGLLFSTRGNQID